MKRFVFFVMILVSTISFANTISLGKHVGGYGVGITEDFSVFYLSQDFSVTLVGTPYIPLLSLNQGEGITFTIPFDTLKFVGRGGVGSSLLFTRSVYALTFWTEIRGTMYFRNVGLYMGIAYQFAGLNPVVGFEHMNEWIKEFGIEYKW